jgi:uncharacterized protein YndB with AHSA1/START domain
MHQLSSGPEQLILQGDFPAYPRQELFDYWVTPSLVTQWWPSEADISPCSSGSYSFSWPEMGWVLRGIYEEFLPAERLVFSWKWNHEPVDSPTYRVALDFADGDNGGTLLTIRQGVYSELPESQQTRQGHIEGWIHFCMKLAGLRDGIQDSTLMPQPDGSLV